VDGLYCCRRQIDVFFGQISQSLQLCDFLWQFSIPRAILPCCGKTPNLFYRRSESDSIFEKRREYMNHHFQLIVIGSGSGGKDAAVLGARAPAFEFCSWKRITWAAPVFIGAVTPFELCGRAPC
jgi:hypothetical protein